MARLNASPSRTPSRRRSRHRLPTACLAAGLSLGTAASALIGCQRGQVDSSASTQQAVSAELRGNLERARQRRVLFAHKSVGENVLSGLRAVLAESSLEWKIANVEQAPVGAVLVEATPGENGDPRSKVDGFAALVRQASPPPDLALMKLCYVDVVEGTDVAAVFGHYEQTLKQLEQELPQIVFGHVTVPLSPPSRSAKDRVKRWVGRSVWADVGNAKRAEYNARLRAAFPAERIFDLAAIEATRPDGSREEIVVGGQTVPSLVPAYASDAGGHLNALGQRVAAEGFVRFVVAATKDRAP